MYIRPVEPAGNCFLIDPLHVEYLGGDLVPEVALDHCSSWYRYVMSNKTSTPFIQSVEVVHESFSQAFILSFFLSFSLFLYVRSDLGDYPGIVLYNRDHWALDLSHRYQRKGQRRSVAH